jgi:hypothetical protein
MKSQEFNMSLDDDGCVKVTSTSILKPLLPVVLVCVSALVAPQAYAQDAPDDDDIDVGLTLPERDDLDDLQRKPQDEEDGDDDVPTGKVKTPKVHPKVMTIWGAKQSLRLKINKQSFVEGYFDQAISAQDDPYKMETSKFAAGLTGTYLWKGYTLTSGFDIKRNQGGTFSNWDDIHDKTYNVAVLRKFQLSPKWTLSPNIKQTRLLSDKVTKDLAKSDLILPFSYALNKEWTIKALTVSHSTQTFTNRVLDQTDTTLSYSTGVAYKWSNKSTVELSIGKEQRFSNQASAEYIRETITPKYVYTISPTSNIAIGIGREIHSNSAEQISRWNVTPRIAIRWDI